MHIRNSHIQRTQHPHTDKNNKVKNRAWYKHINVKTTPQKVMKLTPRGYR